MAVDFHRVLARGMAKFGEDNSPATNNPTRLTPALLSFKFGGFWWKISKARLTKRKNCDDTGEH